VRLLALSGVGGAPEAAAIGSQLREHGDEVVERRLAPSADGRAARLAGGLIAAEELLTARRPDALVLCGEGGEVATAALVAVKLGIPQARVGAGIRAGERHDPDEIDRAIPDRVADLLLCGDDEAAANLAREGLGGAARVVGDVTADARRAGAEIRAWLESRHR
jgi:UDP-N-acetylglucosamine 2-epimerase (non-hydrolysing)